MHTSRGVPGGRPPGLAQLGVNPIACSGHGLCAELLPELISLDEWGYPVIADQPVPPALAGQAKRAVTDCPALALRLAPAPERAGERATGRAAWRTGLSEETQR